MKANQTETVMVTLKTIGMRGVVEESVPASKIPEMLPFGFNTCMAFVIRDGQPTEVDAAFSGYRDNEAVYAFIPA